jgi:hypothetical protein
MANEQLFTVAGISKLPNGEYKMRFANDVMRVKVLIKGGHEDVRLVELDEPMTKMAAADCLSQLEEFADVVAQATIADYIDSHYIKPKAVKAAKTVKVPRVKIESTPTATKRTEITSEVEDAPF